MKNIVLALPNFRWREAKENIMWHYIPYGLCMLAAVLEKNGIYQVSVLDAYKENLSRTEFSDRISELKPDVVCLAVLMDYFGVTLHMAAETIKMLNRNIQIVGGGVYATTNIEKVIKDPNIDYLIAGEGEHTLPILLDHIFQGKSLELDGIYYLDEMGEVKGKGRSKLIMDLDELPLPAYHLINYRNYIYDVSRNSVDRPTRLPYAELFTSRGCPYHCCFCQVKHIIGQKFRARSAENVLTEVDWLIKEYGIQSIVVLDDNFLVDRNRAIKIMRGFSERRLDWKMTATAVFLLDDELLEIMKETGCKYIDCAIESGTYRVLHQIVHKPIKSFEQVIATVRKAQSLGIYVAANFIVGFPGETWDEIRATLKFAEELDADYTKVFNAIPLPHTEMYDTCVEKGYLAPNYNSENVDWKSGYIETEEFSKEDLMVLRAYEWDRINFTKESKRKKTIQMMNITEQELHSIRKNTRRDICNLLAK